MINIQETRESEIIRRFVISVSTNNDPSSILRDKLATILTKEYHFRYEGTTLYIGDCSEKNLRLLIDRLKHEALKSEWPRMLAHLNVIEGGQTRFRYRPKTGRR